MCAYVLVGLWACAWEGVGEGMQVALCVSTDVCTSACLHLREHGYLRIPSLLMAYVVEGNTAVSQTETGLMRRVLGCCVAGLSLEPGNEALKSGLEDARAALRGNGAGGPGGFSLFGPDFMTKLLTNPETREYLSQPDFMAMLEVHLRTRFFLCSDATHELPRCLECLVFFTCFISCRDRKSSM